MADAPINTEQKEEQTESVAKEQKPKKPRVQKVAVQKEKEIKEADLPFANQTMLFDKYTYEVEILDLSLKNYINLKPLAYPATYRRGSQKSFSKANLNIVERLSNTMMRGGTGGKIGGHIIRTKGRLQGKKLKAMKIIEEAFVAINKQTGKNPIQVLIRALENSAPIEDTTRVVYGGIKSNVAVDISASRRLDTALRNIAMAAIIGSFGNRKRLSEALASELILAANMDVNSYALKRKNEIERMARSAK
jgi:small subunit ribosomal protein S7